MGGNARASINQSMVTKVLNVFLEGFLKITRPSDLEFAVSHVRALRDDFDGCGSPAPHPMAIICANDCADQILSENIDGLSMGLAALGKGGVGLSMRHDGRVAYAEWSNDGESTLSLSDACGGEVVEAGNCGTWERMIRWVYRGETSE